MKQMYALSAMIAGICWISLNLALVGAWERGSVFPTYEFLNALRPLPLALMAFALYGVYRSTGRGRTGLLISLGGLVLLAAGAAIEFWVGGGVRDGDVDTLSLVGWTTYLGGYVVFAIGLFAFAILLDRAGGNHTASLLLLALALSWAAWLPLVLLAESTGTNLADASQLLFGGLWVLLGVQLWKGLAEPLPILEN
jgi:hypothetical protein